VAQETIWHGATPATVAEVVGLLEPFVEQVAGPGARAIGVDVDLLRKLGHGQRMKLAMKLVDKGLSGRVLFGRGIGEIIDQGVFAVVSFRILMPTPPAQIVSPEVAEPK